MISIYLVGAAIETSAHNTYAQILVGRLLTGLGVGATSGLVPVIQAEQCPPRWRGLVTGSFQWAVTMGIWGVSMCSWQMQMRTGDISWRITTSLQMVWAGLLLVVFFFSPESPRFLGKIGKWEESRRNLANLRGLPYDSEAITVSCPSFPLASNSDPCNPLTLSSKRWLLSRKACARTKSADKSATPNASRRRTESCGEQ